MPPPRGMHYFPRKAVQAGDVQLAGRRELARAGEEELAFVVPSGAGHQILEGESPSRAIYDPLGAADGGVERDFVSEGIPVRDAVQVGPQLGGGRQNAGLGWVGGEGEAVEGRGDVAGGAGVLVGGPGAAEGELALKDDQVGDVVPALEGGAEPMQANWE